MKFKNLKIYFKYTIEGHKTLGYMTIYCTSLFSTQTKIQPALEDFNFSNIKLNPKE